MTVLRRIPYSTSASNASQLAHHTPRARDSLPDVTAAEHRRMQPQQVLLVQVHALRTCPPAIHVRAGLEIRALNAAQVRRAEEPQRRQVRARMTAMRARVDEDCSFFIS